MSDTLIPRWPVALSTKYRNNSAYDNGTVINGHVENLALHSYPRDHHDLHDSGEANKYFLVPHQLSPIFTGRQELVDKLKAALCTDPGSGPLHPQTKQKRAVVYGLGGSGKTQLSLKFLSDVQQR